MGDGNEAADKLVIFGACVIYIYIYFVFLLYYFFYSLLQKHDISVCYVLHVVCGLRVVAYGLLLVVHRSWSVVCCVLLRSSPKTQDKNTDHVNKRQKTQEIQRVAATESINNSTS